MNLNEGQLAAINSTTSKTLVLAGAGTGKTRVIVKRIEKLIQEGTPASKIIATTFTNKAAFELKQRLISSIGVQGNEIICGTFHKISAQILRSHHNLIGLESNFQLLNEDDQKRLIKRILQELGKEGTPKNILEAISQIKETKIPSEDKLIKQIFPIYQDELARNRFLDYSDLIQKAVFLFKQYPDLTHEIAHSVLVDEYQDVNLSQYEWITLLSQKSALFCVGDEDQSIYAFRGANIKYIQQFEKDFPECSIIKLEENYRSCKEILKGATNLISKNNKKFHKNLFTTNELLKGQIRITKVYNEYQEAEFIAKSIAVWKSIYPDYKIGVLVRTNMQISYIEHALVEAKIPYAVNTGRKFYAKKEIQDVIAYLRAIEYPNDFLAFSRIINAPKRNMGDVRINTLLDAMKSLGCEFESALQTLMHQLPRNASEKCRILLMQMQNWRKIKDQVKVKDLIKQILSDVKYAELEELKENQQKNIEALKDQSDQHENLINFLENLQFSTQDEGQVDVEIMTMHAAKGLEFDIVFSPGWEEDIFPSALTRTKDELEEERRLAYVAITRAKHFLEITHAISRKIQGRHSNQMPSRFIFDL
jgi:DNA helicase-2/ATP-dependent DNA helicase PcrA